MLRLACHQAVLEVHEEQLCLRTQQGQFCFRGHSEEVTRMLRAPTRGQSPRRQLRGLTVHWGQETDSLHPQRWLHIQVEDQGRAGVYLHQGELHQLECWLAER